MWNMPWITLINSEQFWILKCTAISILDKGLESYVIMGLWSGWREITHTKPLVLEAAASQSQSGTGGSSGLYSGTEKEGSTFFQVISSFTLPLAGQPGLQNLPSISSNLVYQFRIRPKHLLCEMALSLQSPNDQVKKDLCRQGWMGCNSSLFPGGWQLRRTQTVLTTVWREGWPSMLMSELQVTRKARQPILYTCTLPNLGINLA